MMSKLLGASVLSVFLLVVSFSNIRTTFAFPSGGKSCNFRRVHGDAITNIFTSSLQANASSILEDNSQYNAMSAFDGNLDTRHISKKMESNAWLFVDLQKSHLIFEIRVTAFYPGHIAGLWVYLSEDATAFFKDGKLNVNSSEVQLFAHQVTEPANNTVTFKRFNGMCGRYVLLYRQKLDGTFLVIRELEGAGYVLT